MHIAFVENRGGGRLVPIASFKLRLVPRKGELVRLQEAFGAKQTIFRVAEVIHNMPGFSLADVNLPSTNDEAEVRCSESDACIESPLTTVILSRQFTDQDHIEAIQREAATSYRQAPLFGDGSPEKEAMLPRRHTRLKG